VIGVKVWIYKGELAELGSKLREGRPGLAA